MFMENIHHSTWGFFFFFIGFFLKIISLFSCIQELRFQGTINTKHACLMHSMHCARTCTPGCRLRTPERDLLPLLLVGEHGFRDGELVGDVGTGQVLNHSSRYVDVICGEAASLATAFPRQG